MVMGMEHLAAEAPIVRHRRVLWEPPGKPVVVRLSVGVVGGRGVVGFCRSHTRSGAFGITVEDAYVYSAYFRKASDVFLLIKSNEGAAPTAGFIIREGGKVLSDTPCLVFPFDQNLALEAAREEA